MKRSTSQRLLTAFCVALIVGVLIALAAWWPARKLEATRERLAKLGSGYHAPPRVNPQLMAACATLSDVYTKQTDALLRGNLSRFRSFLEVSYRNPQESSAEHRAFMSEMQRESARLLRELDSPLDKVRKALGAPTEVVALEDLPALSSKVEDFNPAFLLLIFSVHAAIQANDLARAVENFCAALRLAESAQALGTRAALERHTFYSKRIDGHLRSNFTEVPLTKEQVLLLTDALVAGMDPAVLPAAIARDPLLPQTPAASGTAASMDWLPMLWPLRNYLELAKAEDTYELARAAAMPWQDAARQLELLHRKTARRRAFGARSRESLAYWRVAIIDQVQLRVERDLMALGMTLDAEASKSGGYPESLNPVSALLERQKLINPVTATPYHYRPILHRYKLFAEVPSQSYWKRRFDSQDFYPIPEPGPITLFHASSHTDLDGSVLYPEIPLREDMELSIWREDEWWDRFRGYMRPN